MNRDEDGGGGGGGGPATKRHSLNCRRTHPGGDRRLTKAALLGTQRICLGAARQEIKHG
jgi:hypothetical protein